MRYRLFVLAFGFAFLVPAVAAATSVIPMDFKTVAGKADVIAHGRVVALAPQWASDHGGIDTVVTLAVSDYLKGDLGAQVVFRVPGGEIGRWRMVRVGAPVFHEGEEIVVFLAASNSAELPHIVGFNQGVLRVRRDTPSGIAVVAAPMLAAETATPTPLLRGDPSRRPLSLTQLAARVRSALEPNQSARPAGEKPAAGTAVKRVR